MKSLNERFGLQGRVALVTGASEGSDFVTGHTLFVDDGWVAGS